MKTMTVGAFNAHYCSVIEKVHAKGEAVIITKRGKPIAKLMPTVSASNDIFNFLAGKGRTVGDIISPVIW